MKNKKKLAFITTVIVLTVGVVMTVLYFNINKPNNKIDEKKNYSKLINEEKYQSFTNKALYGESIEEQEVTSPEKKGKGSAELLELEVETNLPEDIKRKILNDTEADSLLNIESAINAGFTKSGSEKILKNNGQAILEISELPKIIQDTVKSQLESRKKLGYDEVSDDESSQIINALKISHQEPIKLDELSFKPESDKFMSQIGYNYYGYFYPKGFRNNDNNISNTISRVYTNQQKQVLIIQESILQGGSATLISPFVNRVLNGYPASFSKKKAPNLGAYSLLSSSIDDKDFNIYKIGENLSNSTEQEAVFLFL